MPKSSESVFGGIGARRASRSRALCCSSRDSAVRAVLLAAAALLVAVPVSGYWTSALAQCRPPRNSNEARLLAFYSVPVVFSADAASLVLPPGALRLSAEGALVPTPSATLQHTDYCYTGRAENTSLTRFFGRPRLAVGLPMGFGFEASYLPAITVASATPNLASAALWLTRPLTSTWQVTGRIHGTTGTVRGPITCPERALQQQDAQAPCYGTSPSVDEFRPDMAGAELILSMRPDAAARVRLSGGLGVNRLQPRFRVGFSDLSGGTDRTRIAVDLTRITALAGASMTLSHGCDVSAQAFTSLSDAATVRVSLGCLLIR